MARVINFGSVNIDHVYTVSHIVQPGETLASSNYRRFAGGKGFNQSVALAHAGSEVLHAGRIGRDGEWLKTRLASAGVDTRALSIGEEPTGHAIIQVTVAGQNSIVLHGGANHCIASGDIDAVLSECGQGDLLLLQNEINAMPEIMAAAGARGIPIAFNPAPMSDAVLQYPLEHVRLFIVNEIEGAQLSGVTEPRKILAVLRQRFPKAHVLLTLGPEGAMAANDDGIEVVPAYPAKVVDTTAAGDTFIGFFLATRRGGAPLRTALEFASAAAALCCTRHGAADAIPTLQEVREFVK